MTSSATTAAPEPEAETGFVHPALFYRDTDEYVAGVGGFVRDALEADEPVFVAVPPGNLDALREGLGAAAAAVSFTDMTRLGRNPGRILAALRDFADSHPGRAARLVGEPIWASRTPAEIREATRHEALINTAFEGRTATILCPYDVSALPAAVVADAERTHPTLIADGGHSASPRYCRPAEVCADCDTPLPDPVGAETLVFARGELGRVRDFADAWIAGAAGEGADAVRLGDLLLAVSEAAANSIAHGGGGGTLRLWREGSSLVAEVRDEGVLADPLAGRRRPRLDSANGGRGLWIINQVCDLVESRATAQGLTLRLHMAITAPAG